jgi:23S rRNA G2445 N2-methylase RlmL
LKTQNKWFSDLSQILFHSSCIDGLDQFLHDEIESYQLNIVTSNRGGTFFKGSKKNLFEFFSKTRFSSRISMILSKFYVRDAEDLYDIALQLPWELILPLGKKYRIDSNTKDALSDSRYALYKLKDAIQDRIRKKENREAEVDRAYPDLEILLKSHMDTVSIQIGITNVPLFKRGYKLETSDAPLKETLAQGLIFFSNWIENANLIDPMCGSGTIPIEAALLLKNQGRINLPILNKSTVFQLMFDTDSGKENTPNSSNEKKIFGFDIDPNCIEISKRNAKRAGVEEFIHFECIDFFELHNKYNFRKNYIVTNPPYGERIGDIESAKVLYQNIGSLLKTYYSETNFSVICGNKSLLGYFKLKAESEKSITISNFKGKIVNYYIK